MFMRRSHSCTLICFDLDSINAGRISFLFMKPMTFKEFLLATDEEPALRALTNATLSHPCSQSIHVKLLSLVQDYFQIGGMPAVVDSYAKSKSWLKAREIQSTLIQSYRLAIGGTRQRSTRENNFARYWNYAGIPRWSHDSK